MRALWRFCIWAIAFNNLQNIEGWGEIGMEELGFNKVLRHVASDLSQAFIEGEVALPVGKPEMARVLMVRGLAETGSVEILDGRAMTDGTLTLNVCYLCEAGTVQSFESVSTFKHTADVPGARPGMRGNALAWASGVDYTITDSRRLNVSAVVDIMFQIEDEMQLDAVDASMLPEGVIAETVDMKLFKSICRASSAMEVEGDCDVPQGMPEVSQVLSCGGYAVINDAFAEEGSVGLQGELKLELMYSTENEETPIAQFFTSIPFSDMIAAPGAGERHSVMARAKLKHVYARVGEDYDTLHIEAVCAAEVSCEEQFELSAVQDAYSITTEVTMEKSEVRSRVRSAVCKGKHAVREKQQLKSDAVPTMVMAASATPSAPRTVASDDGIVIESVLFCQAMFTAQDNTPHAEVFELPVRIEEDAPGFTSGNFASSMIYVDQIQANFTGGEFEFKVLVSWQAEQYTESVNSIVCSLECDDESASKPESGIVVCFAAEGDTLWSIAKRYRVSTDDVVRYNPQAMEGINYGDKMILMCRP